MEQAANESVRVTVRILSKEYTVACPVGQEAALMISAKRIDHEMRQIREGGKVLGTDRIAVMVALNLANELLQLQQRPPLVLDNGTDVSEQLQRMQHSIDAALSQYPSPPSTEVAST